MAAAVKAAVAKNYSSVKMPAMFNYSKDDMVVRADLTLQMSARWVKPVTTVRPQLGAGDDPSKQVIAGDMISPSQTARSVAAILKWYGELE